MTDIAREEELRIHALGAAISRREWSEVERAHAAIRDEFHARQRAKPTPSPAPVSAPAPGHGEAVEIAEYITASLHVLHKLASRERDPEAYLLLHQAGGADYVRAALAHPATGEKPAPATGKE